VNAGRYEGAKAEKAVPFLALLPIEVSPGGISRAAKLGPPAQLLIAGAGVGVPCPTIERLSIFTCVTCKKECVSSFGGRFPAAKGHLGSLTQLLRKPRHGRLARRLVPIRRIAVALVYKLCPRTTAAGAIVLEYMRPTTLPGYHSQKKEEATYRASLERPSTPLLCLWWLPFRLVQRPMSSEGPPTGPVEHQGRKCA
jgi:hypothetical protein